MEITGVKYAGCTLKSCRGFSECSKSTKKYLTYVTFSENEHDIAPWLTFIPMQTSFSFNNGLLIETSGMPLLWLKSNGRTGKYLTGYIWSVTNNNCLLLNFYFKSNCIPINSPSKKTFN